MEEEEEINGKKLITRMIYTRLLSPLENATR